ncbi:L-type lectin-domain containing receptor kinase IX.1-like [Tripterygium wilfordii]|uniref:L-type lectin-domain containing receptor kinase IX.1-like n=1 Tax=Tripterygium wilfordii TaxID=458696 RepID=UPI0018F81E8E|nr:L-type lectin-domain containing receptor kinase IX.1-like [Tripterygium wilfordii]
MDATYFIDLVILFMAYNFLFLALTSKASASLNFNFSSFDSNQRELLTEGHASVVLGTIQLTLNMRDKGQGGSAGRATYKEPFHLWDKSTGNLSSFATHFTFIINSQGNPVYGDGLTFFLASRDINYWNPSSLARGGGLGLSKSAAMNQITSNSTDVPFVAIEFDTYHNPWDPLDDHVGINLHSMVSVKNMSWPSNTKDGNMTEVWITYNATIKSLSVMFSYIDLKNQRKVGRFTHEVDMRSFLPERVILGFSGSTGLELEINTICSWSFQSKGDFRVNESAPMAPSPGIHSSPAPAALKKKKNETKLKLGFGIGVCSLVVVLVFVLLCSWQKKGGRENGNTSIFNVSFSNEFKKGLGPRKFLYNELAEATKNFAEEEKLGEGGFGAVYRGFLKELNSYIAVKKISSASKQGIKEYASEVKIISRLRHKNLVKLLGWCHEKELVLAYEFMLQRSLDTHLFKGKGLLTWVLRYKIAQGLASALLYLHEEADFCVLHRDIKSSNIMLDSSFNAKLGDFGLARLVDHEKGSQTTRLAGTMGYMAPECFMSGKASKATDVYSFGVVALEIASGRKAVDTSTVDSITAEEFQIGLVEWVWKLYGKGKVLEAVDPKLNKDFDEQQVERLMVTGLWCVHPDHKFRPSIRQVINVLDFEAPMPIIPSQMPVLAYVNSSTPSTSSTASSFSSSSPFSI